MRTLQPVIDIREMYKVGKIIGEGSFGQVRKVALRETGKIYAMKVIKKSNI